MSKKTFELDGFIFALSEETLAIYDEHQSYCAAGKEWLHEFDSEGEGEFEIIERFKLSVEKDLIGATECMTKEQQEDLLDLLMFSTEGDDAFDEYFTSNWDDDAKDNG